MCVKVPLAVARDCRGLGGLSIRWILHALEPLRSRRVRTFDQAIESPPETPNPTRQILDDLNLEMKAPLGR